MSMQLPSPIPMRLRRLNHTQHVSSRLPQIESLVQTERGSSTTPFRLAAMNSIGRGVKLGDLSVIVGHDLKKLAKMPSDSDNVEYASAHMSLAQVRERFDKLKDEIRQKELKVTALKEEVAGYKVREAQFSEGKGGGRNQCLEMEKKLNDKKTLFEESDINLKVMQSMEFRLKHDKIVMDQQRYDAEKELRNLKKQMEIIVTESNVTQEDNSRTKDVFIKLNNYLEQEQAEREAHLRSLEEMIGERTRIQEMGEQRKEEMVQVCEQARQQRTGEEKQWNKLFLSHKMLQGLLRDKMYKQMETHSQVENAFKSIKIATGVNDAQVLIKKYLTKEQVYGELLSRISQNQRYIEVLKADKQDLTKQQAKLKNQRELLASTKQEKIQLSKEEKILAQINDKQNRCQLAHERISAFLRRTAKKMKGFDVAVDDQSETQVNDRFKSVLKCLSNQLDQLNTVAVNEPSITSKDLLVFTQAVSRIMESSETTQDDQQLGSLAEQTEHIDGYRNEILRTNEKFMKQLTKKRSDILKLKIEEELKNRERAAAAAVVAKPKVVVEE